MLLPARLLYLTVYPHLEGETRLAAIVVLIAVRARWFVATSTLSASAIGLADTVAVVAGRICVALDLVSAATAVAFSVRFEGEVLITAVVVEVVVCARDLVATSTNHASAIGLADTMTIMARRVCMALKLIRSSTDVAFAVGPKSIPSTASIVFCLVARELVLASALIANAVWTLGEPGLAAVVRSKTGLAWLTVMPSTVSDYCLGSTSGCICLLRRAAS
jgi:hypothetical protein